MCLLLENEAKLCPIFACCMEVVCAAYGVSSLAFPAVLRISEISAFDFGKAIESFVEHEPTLPKYLRSHFAKLQAKILESLVWVENSPLHALMDEYDTAKRGSGTVAQSSQTRARAGLERFLEKVRLLAAARTETLCKPLRLAPDLIQQVGKCLEAIVKNRRHLLRGRHLDQIILCTVYAVCKVNLMNSITFERIIAQYKQQPQASAI